MVEDEENIVKLVQTHIELLGFDFEHAGDGEVGLERALVGDISLLILDVMLPRLDGVEICRRLRAANSTVPIIMLTARGDELDRVMGLELGADDYITKPFSVAELKSRIKALLRRTSFSDSGTAGGPQAVGESDVLKFKDLEIDFNSRLVLVQGNRVQISGREFDLLALFARNPGKAFSRDAILGEIWGTDLEAYQSNVNTQITRLRKKIELDPNNPTFILTVRGYGYRFAQLDELQAQGQLLP
jgi:DNA-binding response OmpR family regulator